MAATATKSPVTIRDTAGDLEVDLQVDLASTTPQQLIEHLMAEGDITARTPQGHDLIYQLARIEGTTSIELNATEPLAAQGVNPGDTLDLITGNVKG